MVPPTKDANQIDPSVPLPKWVVLRAFDAAAACNDAQDQLRYRVSRLNLQIPVASAASEAAEFSRSAEQFTGATEGFVLQLCVLRSLGDGALERLYQRGERSRRSGRRRKPARHHNSAAGV
jgi:hypothetical protein